MATYTYTELYEDACKGVIRCDEDAECSGITNSEDICVVVDRKWGECTPEVDYVYFTANKEPLETTIPSSPETYWVLYNDDGTTFVNDDPPTSSTPYKYTIQAFVRVNDEDKRIEEVCCCQLYFYQSKPNHAGGYASMQYTASLSKAIVNSGVVTQWRYTTTSNFSKGNTTIQAGASTRLQTYEGAAISYDSTKTYTLVSVCYYTGTYQRPQDKTNITLENVEGVLHIRNNGSESIQISHVYYDEKDSTL